MKRSPKKTHENTLTILGSGTSGGVPFIGCACKICRSRNPKNKRTRASAWFQVQSKSIVIDTGPDFRLQALREKISRIDAVLYTHPHADHIHGIDDLRSYNFIQNEPIPCYGNAWTCEDLPIKFSYIFKKSPPKKPGDQAWGNLTGYGEGGGIPMLDLKLLDPKLESIDIKGVSAQYIPHQHGSRESLGYRIDSVAYIADCSYIPPTSLDRLKGLSALVLDCVRLEPHRTHLNLDRALELIEQIKPQKAYLTHLGHEFDYENWMKKLPRGVGLAYDGLKIRF